MGRISTHKIETKTKGRVKKLIDETEYSNISMLFREISERDYGIDAIIEIFKNDNPTGIFALIQVKGTENKIEKNKKSDDVSCSISTSNARYAFQQNIPVFLTYVSLKNKSGFYYVSLQKALKEKKIKEDSLNEQKSITIRIPINNYIDSEVDNLVNEILEYYNN